MGGLRALLPLTLGVQRQHCLPLGLSCLKLMPLKQLLQQLSSDRFRTVGRKGHEQAVAASKACAEQLLPVLQSPKSV